MSTSNSEQIPEDAEIGETKHVIQHLEKEKEELKGFIMRQEGQLEDNRERSKEIKQSIDSTEHKILEIRSAIDTLKEKANEN